MSQTRRSIPAFGLLIPEHGVRFFRVFHSSGLGFYFRTTGMVFVF